MGNQTSGGAEHLGSDPSLLAGVRHLLSDIEIGSRLGAARCSAWIVNCSGVLITLLSVGALL
jgi:succinate dehydrogenase / fumarate reductase cytochrome b subunit